MDFRTLVIFSSVLIVTAGADEAKLETSVTFAAVLNTSNSTISIGPPAAPTSNPNGLAPVLGFLTVRWTSQCEGQLIVHQLSRAFSHVCHGSLMAVQNLLENVCETRKGCEDILHLDRGTDIKDGYHISLSGLEPRTSCQALKVNCTVEPEEDLSTLQRQLQFYKVVTIMFCLMLLVLLLIRFTRPTIKALQKRWSNRRQNRWIGPTQSHSVSYHREKTAVKNNEQRMSYPALERLTISDSREPSSNRNSDYNF